MNIMEGIQMNSVDVQSTSTADALPSCLICGGPGHGLHYGVNTCDACKGFFHRSMRIHSVYKCSNDATCHVRYGKGKMCKLCRYKKCLEVGMSEKAIKLGRHSTKRRYDSLLELEWAHKANMASSLTPQQSTSTVDVKQPINPHPDEKEAVTRLGHPDVPVTSGDASKVSFIPMAEGNNASPLHRYPTPSSDEEYSPGHKAMIIGKATNYSASIENVHLDHIDCGRPHTPITPPQTNCASGNVPKEDYKGILQPLSDRAHVTGLFTDTDIVLKNLMAAEQAYVGTFGDKCRSEMLFKQAEAHYEECKLRAEMFGKLRIVNDDEKQDQLYKQTGLHAGECLKFLTNIIEASEMNVRKMVRFMKTVPGFSLFTMTDKINLLKNGCSAFTFLSLYGDVQLELGVIYVAPGLFFCHLDGIRYSHWTDISAALEQFIGYSKMMQAQNLTDEERLILRTLSVITPDCSDLDNVSLAHEIHWTLREMMISVLAKRHQNPQIPFATVMSIMTELRSTHLAFNSWMANLNESRYISEQSPLLKEIIDVKTFARLKESTSSSEHRT